MTVSTTVAIVRPAYPRRSKILMQIVAVHNKITPRLLLRENPSIMFKKISSNVYEEERSLATHRRP